MFELNKRNRGAVSIFLIIVLVPMLIVSSIFVDVGRLKLAKAVAESAGDLTLNTALTNYDAVLKDMYGLFAASQDVDELYDNLETYYRKSVEAAGIPEVDAENYVDQIMQFLKSESGSDDLLNIDLTDFEVIRPTGAHLGNPAILKTQIVEFMKYRAPINLGMGIFDALNSFKNLKAQTKLVDDKNNFYSNHYSGMMEKLEKAWNYIENYQFRDAYKMFENDPCTFPQGKYLERGADLIENSGPYKLISEMKMAIAYTIRYLYFSDGYYVPSSGFENYKIEYIQSDDEDEDWIEKWEIVQGDYLEKEIFTVYREPEVVDFNFVENILRTAWNNLQILKNSDDEIFSVKHDYSIKNDSGNRVVSDSEMIRLVSLARKQVNEDDNYHKILKNVLEYLVLLKNVINAYDEEMLNAYKVIVKPDNSISLLKDVSEGVPLTSFVNEELLIHLDDDTGYIKSYKEHIAGINNYHGATWEIIKSVRSFVERQTQCAAYYTWMLFTFVEGKISLLDSAITELNAVKGDLENPESEYNKALNTWKASAGSKELENDTLANNDKSEIERLQKVLTKEKVEKLITRLTSAKQSLNLVKTQIETHVIFGIKWQDICTIAKDNDIDKSDTDITELTIRDIIPDSYKSEIEALELSNIVEKEKIRDEFNVATELDAYYDTAYEEIILKLQNTVAGVGIQTSWEGIELAKSPDLTKNQDSLYTWLYNNFTTEGKLDDKYNMYDDFNSYDIVSKDSVGASNEVTSGKDDADATQSGMDEVAKDQNDESKNPTPKNTAPTRETLPDTLPSLTWAGEKGKVLTGDSDTACDSDSMLKNTQKNDAENPSGLGMLSGLLDAVESAATTLRDDMFIVNYIMNMFSYSTYEAEITKKYVDNDLLMPWYEEKDGVYTYTDKFKANENSAKMVDDAKTLTNVPISPSSNYLYGQEVEYIIYGKDGVSKAQGTIYMIRFALNTVYAFMDAEIGNLTTAAATALFGTPPLTPLVPIAKIAMTIGIALAESAYDLHELKCGNSIPLMKNSKTWVMKPSNIAGEVIDKVVDVAAATAEEILDEGTKILNDVLDMTNEKLQQFISEGADKIEELSEAAVQITKNEITNYGNMAVQELVNICNEINNDMMLDETLEYTRGSSGEKVKLAKDALQAWLSKQEGTEADIDYLAKKTAVDILLSGTSISDLFNAIDKEVLTEKIGQKADDINDILNEVKQSIDKKINDLAENAGNALNDMTNNIKKNIEEAADKGVESLRSTLKDSIGKAFGVTNKSKSTDNVVSSLLSWTYSDYLQLMLLVAIISSPESVLLKTADVIELNMRLVRNDLDMVEVIEEKQVSRLFGLIKYMKKEKKLIDNPEAYHLYHSYTKLKIKATIEVKPLLLGLPLMGEVVNGKLAGTNWYEFTYEGTMGY